MRHMIFNYNRAICIGMLVYLIMSSCKSYENGVQPGPDRTRTSIDAGLTAEEFALSREISEAALQDAGLLQPGPVYFVGAELFRDKTEEEVIRKALSTHYSYPGDLTIHTVVNFFTNQADRIDTLSHVPTGLSEQEMIIARDMALANTQVREILGNNINAVEVEGLLLTTVDPADSLYQKRVVSVLFNRESDYLATPPIWINLNDSTVYILPPGRTR